MTPGARRNRPTFSQVIDAWDKAGEEDIHPLWNAGAAYWESGEYQSNDVGRWSFPGATVIDFGCGNGRLTIPLARAGYKVIAVDSSQVMLDRLKTYADQAGVQVRTILSDGENLRAKLKKVRADVVLARAVLIHHGYEDAARIVRNLSGVLKPGGHLIADWTVGTAPAEGGTWISVTTWGPKQRLEAADAAGLKPVFVSAQPTVWQKKS